MDDLDIWQEYDCPGSGIDFDLHGSEILAVGEQCYCSGCDRFHTAGSDIQPQTYIRLADGELDYRDAPKGAEEKAAWIAEAAKVANDQHEGPEASAACRRSLSMRQLGGADHGGQDA